MLQYSHSYTRYLFLFFRVYDRENLTVDSKTSYFFHLAKNIPAVETEAEQWRIIRECHESTGNSVEAKAMSGHFGRQNCCPYPIQSILPRLQTKDYRLHQKLCCRPTCEMWRQV